MSHLSKKPPYYYKQSGVIAYKFEKKLLHILLITSRKKKKWIIPKGIIEPGYTASESAAKEAVEEAGVIGKIIPEKIGEYAYEKWGGLCTVSLYPLKVEKMLDMWPEDFRERKWVSTEEAMNYVTEPELRKILLFLDTKLPESIYKNK